VDLDNLIQVFSSEPIHEISIRVWYHINIPLKPPPQLRDNRVWEGSVSLCCYPAQSDKNQKPYELICNTASIDSWLNYLYKKYAPLGFFGGSAYAKDIFNERDLSRIPGFYRTFGEELCRFMKRNDGFRKEVLTFLQKPDKSATEHVARKSEDIVEMLSDIKFVSPRKMWIVTRGEWADLWVLLMKVRGT
jgi:hypothetical protein